MIEWEVGESHLRAVDQNNAEVFVRSDDFVVDSRGADIPRPVDETVAVAASELRFPHAVVYAFSLADGERYELDPDGAPLDLPSDEYVVDVDTEVKTYLRFSGPATISRTDDFADVVVSFPERRRLSVGFRSRHELPAGTITVPDRPADFATALSALASSHKTDGPDRTYPTLRGHPPLLERGDELSIPDAIADEVPDTGVELVVPPSYEATFVVAPLAYYLQAQVRTSERDGPALVLPEVDRRVSLSSMPALERDVERLLRKTFFLDCLVRNVGPYGTNLWESSILEVLDVDPPSLYEASPQERLATYLDVPYEAVEHRLPEWHLATYVTPDAEFATTIPFLLDRMSLLYLPRTSELEGKELVERSLEDFYRGTANDPREGGTHAVGAQRPGRRASAGEVASVDIVKPELRSGRVHGWLADGVPIDVFKSAPEAYRNRLGYLSRSSDATSICVVLNDPEMEGERTGVADIYRERSEDLAIDVTVEESLGTAALARVFESPYDFVHYIGHCEEDGLRCPDGNLSASSLDGCAVQTFFLNACGSFYEGQELIEQGSVAGAVTFTQVLNDHAVKVGSTFAKLLVHGFSIERAMGLARRRIMMGKDYAVVGDGTHTLTQGDHRIPTTATVERVDDDRFALTIDCFSTQMTGSYYFPHTEGNEHAYLSGTESSFVLDRNELVTFLEETESPVIYDGDVVWSKELYRRFERA